jgi:DNA-directed RNA polymerase sigma subunit (sigma70/sigma32)
LQAIAGALDMNLVRGYRDASFIMIKDEDAEIIKRAAKGDAEAKLKLVKDYLDMVVEIASKNQTRNGGSFVKKVKAGTLAVINAAKKFHVNNNICFKDCARDEMEKAMKEII